MKREENPDWNHSQSFNRNTVQTYRYRREVLQLDLFCLLARFIPFIFTVQNFKGTVQNDTIQLQ